MSTGKMLLEWIRIRRIQRERRASRLNHEAKRAIAVAAKWESALESMVNFMSGRSAAW